VLRKSTKDHSAKLTAVSAVLDQLTPEILKTSDGEVLRKFHAVVQRWRSWPRLSSCGAMKNDEAPMSVVAWLATCLENLKYAYHSPRSRDADRRVACAPGLRLC